MRRDPHDRVPALAPWADKLAAGKRTNDEGDARRGAPRRELVHRTDAEARLAGIRRFLAARARLRAQGLSETELDAATPELARRAGATGGDS